MREALVVAGLDVLRGEADDLVVAADLLTASDGMRRDLVAGRDQIDDGEPFRLDACSRKELLVGDQHVVVGVQTDY